MARLIRTETEVEGRFEEVWLVVDEDALEQWPEGPREVVGRPTVRADGPARARGEALFTADIQLPGMLHTAVLRSPHAHARVRKIDLSAALAAPGVRGAVGPGDCPMVDGHCNYEGAAAAAICADTFRQAQAALKLIEVEWEELDAMLDADEAIAAGDLLDLRADGRGDLERGLAEADVVVEATYRTQVVLHNSMETHQSICRWVGDTLEIHTSTQYVWGVRSEVARILELPPDKIRVVCEYMGGGFGSKTAPDDYTFIAAELAKRTGRPVRCALTRREENVIAGNRNATIQRLVAGARADGTLTALGGEFVNAVGFSGWNSLIEGPMQTLYACPNVKTTTRGARLNLPPMKAFRAPGYVEGTFGLEGLLDEIAAKLGLDPLELRRINHAEREPAAGREYSGKNLLECYRRAEPHWERRHEVRARSTATVKRGVGMASQIWWGGGGPPSYAWLRVGSDGRATVVTAGQDVGTGTKTAMAQIAAEELGIPAEHVTFAVGDTGRGPYATLSAGSSTIPSVGPAVRAAAGDARRQILELAAQRYEQDAAALRLERGSIVLPDGERHPLEEIVGLLGNGQILGTGARGPNPAGMNVLTFGVQIAEVAVDVETGEITIERIAAIHDVGRVIDPLGASSQIEGGIIQAIGHTLSEERLTDPASGRILTRSLDAYKMPTIADVPEIIGELIDIPDAQLTNLGSKGLGEPPIVPVAAAIANAIRDATGADIRSLPITRAEMLAALEEAATRERRRTKEPVRRMSAVTELQLVTPASLDEIPAGAILLAGGTEVVPQLRDGLIEAGTLADIRGLVPRGISGRKIGAGATLAEIEAADGIPDALREACRLAASPQLRNMGTVGGNLLQSTRCWYWRLDYPCRLRGGDTCHAREGEHREHAIFANDFCASAHPSDVAAALIALGATIRTNRRELSVRDLYRLPTSADPRLTAIEPGEVLLELDVPPADASVYLKAMDRKRWAFPLVGVAAARTGATTTVALAGVAPVPWLLEGALDDATPLEGTKHKVTIAKALLARALATIEPA